MPQFTKYVVYLMIVFRCALCNADRDLKYPKQHNLVKTQMYNHANTQKHDHDHTQLFPSPNQYKQPDSLLLSIKSFLSYHASNKKTETANTILSKKTSSKKDEHANSILPQQTSSKNTGHVLHKVASIKRDKWVNNFAQSPRNQDDNNFKTLVASLLSAHEVRFYINPLDGSCNISNPGQLVYVQGGLVDSFEYFTDKRFGLQHHFGFSNTKTLKNETGGLMTIVEEGFLYEHTGLKRTITALSLDLTTVIATNTYMCTFPSISREPAVTFISSDHEPQRIETPRELLTALRSGANVRFTANYITCPPLFAGAISGGLIQDYTVDLITSKIVFVQTKVITNYQGEGFVRDIVITHVYPDGNVTFYASDIAVHTNVPVYEEMIYCKFATESSGSVKFYTIP